MLKDTFKAWKRTIDSVSGSAFTVTPSDTDDINACRALYVGNTGDVTVVMADGGQSVTFVNVIGGSVLPIRVSRVNATDTTATNIVALL